MRLAAFAVATLLTVVAIPTAPVVEAASTAVHPVIVAYQNVGDVSVTVMAFAAPYWSCTTTDTSVAPAVDITVDCVGTVLPAGAGACTGVRVGAQSGAGFPMDPTVSDLISPIIAPPEGINPVGTSTLMQVSGFCGTGWSSVSYITPGSRADTGPANWSDEFTCVIHIDMAVGAQPWNAFCYGNE